MPKLKEPTDKNSILMRDCGAKAPYQWEPEPTDHIRYAMNRGDWIAQIVGWVKWHTTRGSRSAWATDDKGKKLTIKHAAEDLGWKNNTAANRFALAIEEGVIRKHPKMGWIGLCADIPKARRIKGDDDSRVQDRLPRQLIEKIESLSAPDQVLFRTAYERFQKWSRDAFGDVATQIRRQQALAEDTILSHFAMAVERKAKEFQPKTAVKVELTEVPDFITLARTDSCTVVQDQSCTTPKHPVVHRENEAHIKEADTDLKAAARETVRKPAAAAKKAAVSDEEAAALAKALREADPLISPTSARRLMIACQKQAQANPPVSVQEVLDVCSALIERKGGLQGSAWREIKNPMGLFLSAVPPAFPAVLTELRKRIA